MKTKETLPYHIDMSILKKGYNAIFTDEDGEQGYYVGSFASYEEAKQALKIERKKYSFNENEGYFPDIILEKGFFKIKNIYFI